MTRKSYVPERGDVISMDFDPQAGHEQAGRRPALVLSPGSYNGKTGLVVVLPITNRVKGYPFEEVIPAGLDVTGVILSDQIKSMDWKARKAKYTCTLPPEVTGAAIGKALSLLQDEEDETGDAADGD